MMTLGAAADAGPTAFEWANLVVGGVGSIGTIAALLFAVSVWREETKRARDEADRRDREAAERHQAETRWQAERVAASMTVDRDAPMSPLFGEGHFAHATVHNESGMPVYDVRVLELAEDGRTVAHPIRYVPPGGSGHVHLLRRSNADLNGLSLAVSFRDAGERWWQKCHDGHLTLCEKDPYPLPARQSRPDVHVDADGGHSIHAPQMRVAAGEAAMRYEPD